MSAARADMDGLPIQEEIQTPVSLSGHVHAYGHDMHTHHSWGRLS